MRPVQQRQLLQELVEPIERTAIWPYMSQAWLERLTSYPKCEHEMKDEISIVHHARSSSYADTPSPIPQFDHQLVCKLFQHLQDICPHFTITGLSRKGTACNVCRLKWVNLKDIFPAWNTTCSKRSWHRLGWLLDEKYFWIMN